jgi:hypothetical protein
MDTRMFAQRWPEVAVVGVAGVLVQATAGFAFAAVFGFDIARHADLEALVARGPNVGPAFRASLLLDMVGYLAVAPVALAVRSRLHATASPSGSMSWLVDVVAFFGLAFSLVGAIGAVLLALAAPPLVDAAAVGGPTESAARVTFEAISRAVDEGLWGPLEWLAAGIWVGGVGWLVRTEGRAFGYAGMAAAVGVIAYGTRTGLTGRNPIETSSPIDVVLLAALGLFAVWEIWLAIRFWRGR